MGIAIFLRKRQLTNKFRDLLISSLNTGIGDEAVICSGFFQELFGKTLYQASTEGGLNNILKKHNISLTTVGVHNNYWLPAYKNFKSNLLKKGLAINAKLSKGLKWHAKVYILKSKGRPIFAIIGSSNMTRSAFSISKPFNFECDVVMWLDEFNQLDTIVTLAIEDLIDYQSEMFITDYNPERNNGLTLEEKLKMLLRDIEDSDLTDLV